MRTITIELHSAMDQSCLLIETVSQCEGCIVQRLDSVHFCPILKSTSVWIIFLLGT